MADRQSARQGNENARQARAPRANRAGKTDGANGADGSRLTAAAVGRSALRQMVELTGKEPEGVSGVQPSDDGWTVTVDVVEDRRIPSTSDVLASYEAELGEDGELISYRRVRRYSRGRGDDGIG
jgi:Gas vesicle synthesis protein GvpO